MMDGIEKLKYFDFQSIFNIIYFLELNYIN